jgi:alpha-beta hydrolase superfamily lysophospholipase
MGSFVAQTLIAERRVEYDGAILCGTCGPPTASERVIGVVAAAQRKVLGGQHAGIWLDRLVLGTYNRHFAPNRTRFDWLSRDEREVDAYADDVLCGFPLTAQSWYDFLRGKRPLGDHTYLRGISKALPILIIAGTRDPVGEEGRGVHRLLDVYRRVGLTRVSCRLYQDARHELLNELNREVITEEVIAWLRGVVSES